MFEKADCREAEEFLRSNPEIHTIDLIVPDINGIPRGKRIDRDTLLKAYKQGVSLPVSIFGMDITGDTSDATGLGFDEGDRDLLCWPIPDTLKPTTWHHKPMAQVMIGMLNDDGTTFYADPRHVLARVQERFKAMKLTPVVAVELEFYLIDKERTVDRKPQTPFSPATGERLKTTQVYGLTELDDFANFIEDVQRAADLQDIPADTAVSEFSPGQYEINLTHTPDALQACDDSVLLKRLIKGVALRHDMEATFMAKPYQDKAGNGMHVHVSLIDENGNNVFSNPGEMIGSELLRWAIGGLTMAMPESMAVFAPNANSYRRFQPDAFVPLAPAWGYNNRTCAIRIPAGPEDGKRIEHRVSGADANPYLVVAAILAGMHYGISNKVEPPPMTVGNAYTQHKPSVPRTWLHALTDFKKADILREYFGNDFCHVYRTCKKEEFEKFNHQVTTLEYEWYLRTV